VVVDLGDGTYAVRLGGDQYFRVDADLPTPEPWIWTPMYAGLGVEDSLWVPIVEKAYAHFRYGTNTYASLEGGRGREGLEGLNLIDVQRTAFEDYADSQALLDDIVSKLDSGLAVTADFYEIAEGVPLIGHHAYTVVGVNRDGANNVVSVILRNPHGPAGADASVTVTAAELFACTAALDSGRVP
jgi:hypothetical protein